MRKKSLRKNPSELSKKSIQIKSYEVIINEAYIIDPLLSSAYLQVYKDKIYLEANDENTAKKDAINTVRHIWKKSFKAMPENIQAVAIRILN